MPVREAGIRVTPLTGDDMQKYHVYTVSKGCRIPRHAGECLTPTGARNCANALASRTDLKLSSVEVRGKYGRVIHRISA